MKKKPLIQIGDPVLRKKAKRVSLPLKAKDKALLRTLVSHMRAHDLVGLSAPQIGVSSRIFVSEVRVTRARKQVHISKLHVCINPVITDRSSRVKGMYEGCGSIVHGDLFAEVPRHVWVKVRYTDASGIVHHERITGLLGEIAQHEIDHLDGILFVDRVVKPGTYITRDLFRRVYKKKKR